MGSHDFQNILESLAGQYGRLDNQVAKWAGHQQAMIDLFPEIEQALVKSFTENNAPFTIFKQGKETYLGLLADLSSRQDAEIPTAYLNLRFYILLNGFLQACQESLEKAALNTSLDPASLVENSYYRPYFFARVTVTREEMVHMLEEEMGKLADIPRDRSGVMAAIRIRKGVVTTLAESYCPTHPMLYPLVQDLDSVKASSDPSVIDKVTAKLDAIRSAI